MDDELVSFRLIPENYHLLVIGGIYKIQYTPLKQGTNPATVEIIAIISNIVNDNLSPYYKDVLILEIISYNTSDNRSLDTLKTGNTLRWALCDDGELFTRLD